MNSVLGFVDEEEAVTAVGKSKGDAEKARCALSEASQRYRTSATFEFHNDPPTSA